MAFFIPNRVNVCLSCAKSQLKLSQSCCLLLVRNFIVKGTINSIYEPTNKIVFGENHPFELIIQVLIQMTETSIYCYDFFKVFTFQAIFDRMKRDNALNDSFGAEEILNHYKYIIDKNATEIDAQRKKVHQSTKKVPLTLDLTLQQNQFYGVGPAETTLSIYSEENMSNEGKVLKIKEPEISFDHEVAMREKQIADLFPDLGDGYIYKCLEHFNFNVELTVDAILCKKLPPQLDSLNFDIQKSDLVSNIHDASTSNPNTSPSDWPTVGRFDPAEIIANPPIEAHIGKKDRTENIPLCFWDIGDQTPVKKVNQWMKDKTLALADDINVKENEEYEAAKLLIERGKITAAELKNDINFISITGIYEDEFDDTYGEEANVDITRPEIEDFLNKDTSIEFEDTPKRAELATIQQSNALPSQSNYNKKTRSKNKKKQQQKQTVVVPPLPPSQSSFVSTSTSSKVGQKVASATEQNRQSGVGQPNRNNRPNQGRQGNSKVNNK